LNCDQSCAAKNFGIATKSTAFCPAAQRKILELRRRALHFVQLRSEKLWNCDEKHCFLSSCAAKNLLRRKALYFVQPRGENFEIVNKSTVFGSGAEKILEVRPKALYFDQPRSEKLWNCKQKHCILFSRAPNKS
jgi:hypothetical protein